MGKKNEQEGLRWYDDETPASSDEASEKQNEYAIPKGAVIVGWENGIPIYQLPSSHPAQSQHNQFGEHARNEGGRKSWWR